MSGHLMPQLRRNLLTTRNQLLLPTPPELSVHGYRGLAEETGAGPLGHHSRSVLPTEPAEHLT